MSAEKEIVIICGMHRSGTSLFSRIVQSAIGQSLEGQLEGQKGNVDGYFEDEDFVYFHSNVIRRSGSKNFKIKKSLEWHRADLKALKLLIADKFKEIGTEKLVIKDPRASLFLDMWSSTGYKIKVIVLFRHPGAVVYSLYRRGADRSIKCLPNLGFKAWIAYYQRIIDFYRSPDFKDKIPMVFIDYDRFVSEKCLCLPPDFLGVGKISLEFYDPKKFTSKPSAMFGAIFWFQKDAKKIYEGLQLMRLN